MDVDESDISILEKTICLRSGGFFDPYEAVMDIIRRDVDRLRWTEKEGVFVPTWLRAIPLPGDGPAISLENFFNFIEKDGCRYFAGEIDNYVSSEVLPDAPCMLGVDHCLSGGAIRSCAGYYGRENLSLVVLDSHLDAVPLPVMEEAIRYDLETNPETVYDLADPFLYNRADSYNTASFLYHLVVREQVVKPENVLVIGIGDYPPGEAFQLTDPRIRNFVEQYARFKELGARVVTRDQLLENRDTITQALREVNTPYLYVSIDLDIGARNALNGVRFINRRGISEEEILYTAAAIRQLIDGRNKSLAGLDVMEFNPRRAVIDREIDRTYQIAAELIKIIAFGIKKHS